MTVGVRERKVSWESESTYGTDVIDGDPSAFYTTLGDAARIRAIREVVECNGVKAVHSGNPHRTYPSHTELTLECELKGKVGAAGTAGVHDALLKACGMEATTVADTSVSYRCITTHTMALAPSATVYEDQYDSAGTRRRQIATGVRGNVTITCEANANALLAFEGQGLFNQLGAPASAGSLPTAYDADKPCLLARAMTLTINSTSYTFASFEVSTNWSIEQEIRATGAASVAALHLRRGDGSRIGGSLSFHDPALLDAIITAYGTDAVYAFSVVLSDGTDTITLAGQLQFGQYDRGAGLISTYSVPFFCVPSDADSQDDLTITYT